MKMSSYAFKLLEQINDELESEYPNLGDIYSEHASLNFDKFAVAMVYLKDNSLINMPKSKFIYGGDNPLPIDIIMGNISINIRGKFFIESLRKHHS